MIVGLTTTDVPVNAPGVQEYEVAPVPVKVADEPTHNNVGVLVAETVGELFTVNEMVPVFEQAPLFPVMV